MWAPWDPREGHLVQTSESGKYLGGDIRAEIGRLKCQEKGQNEESALGPCLRAKAKTWGGQERGWIREHEEAWGVVDGAGRYAHGGRPTLLPSCLFLSGSPGLPTAFST